MSDTRTLKDSFDQVANWYGDQIAFVQARSGTRYSYAEANEQARKFANGLASLGVQKGDRVGFLSQTTVDHAIAYFGTLKLGAIPTTVHNREAPNVIQSLIQKVDPTMLVFQSTFSEDITTMRDRLSVDHYIAFDQKTDGPDFAKSYSEVVERSSAEEPNVEVKPDDTAIINFTSGSTGTPKPVVHTHEEAIESSHISQYLFQFTRQDTLVNPFTPSFIAWQNMTLPVVNAGGTTVFLEEFEPELFLKTVDSEGVTVFLLVPTQFKLLLQANPEKYDLDSIRLMSYAGEPLSEELYRELSEKMAENFAPYWGTTEVMAGGLSLPPYEISEDTLASVGRPLPQIDIRIIEPGSRDPQNTVDSNEKGELIVRGPSVAKKIWKDPEKTEKNFHEDGWWFSGDLVETDENGNVYIVGRTDNMIISGGINVYPESVEGVIESHDSVVEAGIIGVPDEEWGEKLKAYIVLSDETITEEDLDQWCLDNDDLADYQRPRSWEIIESMPRTNTGKLNRKALEEKEDGQI